MSIEIKVPKKLIEVALPLDLINLACSREKSIRHGHPSTLHLWWARRPLAAARAVIFAQMVNDPGYERHLGRGVNKEKAQEERERLFRIIEKLVIWENSNNEEVINEAREEIKKSWRETCLLNKDHPQSKELFNPDVLPGFHDPFAGGGAIPLEAQRLGLDSCATDLNPVAVTINKAMIDIPLRFSERAPVGPICKLGKSESLRDDWEGATGLAEDVRRYGEWVREEAFKKIGNLYPQVEVTKEMADQRADLKSLIGQKLTVITWIFARTVKSPNPAFSHVDVPLVSTFVLSSKKGKEVYVDPQVKGDQYSFLIKLGKAPKDLENGTKLSRGANFKCLVSDTPIEPKYVYSEANAKRMGSRLMAIVADSPRGRLFLPALDQEDSFDCKIIPKWIPDVAMPENPRWFSPPMYGLKNYSDLFTTRQLVALDTFSDLVQEAVKKCELDAKKSGFSSDRKSLAENGTGAAAYAQAIGVYLAFAVGRMANTLCTIARWTPDRQQTVTVFSRQAIPMTWDFPEVNPFAEAAGDFLVSIDGVIKGIPRILNAKPGIASQADAQSQKFSKNRIISTDPPYYDNIGYADLSDFFYVWMAKILQPTLPELFSTRTTPKDQELVATPYRHGGKAKAEAFFLEGMKAALKVLSGDAHPAYPVTIYYAFKQSETNEVLGTSSAGWETFLEAILSAGFSISGTWPMRTELSNRMIGSGTNALASSVVLVCNRRPREATTTSRREFIKELNFHLPVALEEMTTGVDHSPVAPVDLSQAIVGPGMAIFSKYSAVLEADGSPMSIRTALQLINRFLAEDDFDHDTQFCLNWFDQLGWDSGKFGEADVLARAKGTSVDGLKEGGVVDSSRGNLRLLRPNELSVDWKPESDSRISIWEILHHMIRCLGTDGESGAGKILSRISQHSDAIRSLAYRLYTICERKGWAQDASQYDQLVRAWDGIESTANSVGYTETQISLFGDETTNQSKSLQRKEKTRKKKK